MSEKDKKYRADPRPTCKYGEKCYQKNSDHAKKYKHPPKHNMQDASPPRKILKLDNQHLNVSKSPTRMKQTKSPRPSVSTDDDNETSSNTSKNETLSPKNRNDSHCNLKDNSLCSLGNKNDSSNTEETSSSKHNIPDDISSFIEEKFLVKMPKDFFSFWDFCKSISNKNSVNNVFKVVNLYMVGPFDVLLGNLPERENEEDYLLHWRYFYDPPEFQTILMTPGSTEYHMGYYRDSPSELPVFVASNEAGKDCKIKPLGENIFGAVLHFLETAKKKSPFISISCQKIITPLKEWANKHNFTLETKTESMKKRQSAVATRTFHDAGIVVPFDKKTQVGYRPLIETNAKLEILINNVIDAKADSARDKAFAILQPVINMANIATDECDFGTGLELGLNFFCSGEKKFHNSVKQLLGIAYNMLNRNEFEKIINAHLDNRRKGIKLSCAEL